MKQEAKPKRVKERREDVPTLIGWLKDGVLGLERAVAAYNQVSGALQTARGEAPDDRARGLPIWASKASADGVHVMDVYYDCKDIDPQYLEHVLIPWCNAKQREMAKAARLLNNVSAKLLNQISAVVPSEEDSTDNGDLDVWNKGEEIPSSP